MAAALLAVGRTTIDEVPDILDVVDHERGAAPARLRRSPTSPPGGGGGRVVIDVPADPLDRGRLRPGAADARLDQRARPAGRPVGQARVALPGGDAIGSRGLDMHIAGLERLGAAIVSEHGFLVASAPAAHRRRHLAGLPVVGATENLVMAAVLAQGTTVIDNAAREPEIVDLAACWSRWARRSTAPAVDPGRRGRGLAHAR